MVVCVPFFCFIVSFTLSTSKLLLYRLVDNSCPGLFSMLISKCVYLRREKMMVWCQTLQTNLVTVLISMLDVGRSSSWPYLKRLATFSRYLNWREDRCQRVKALRWKKGVRWGNHARGGLKLNVDASFHSNGTGAAGMILRNDHGEANAGYACPLDQLLNATMAEA